MKIFFTVVVLLFSCSLRAQTEVSQEKKGLPGLVDTNIEKSFPIYSLSVDRDQDGEMDDEDDLYLMLNNGSKVSIDYKYAGNSMSQCAMVLSIVNGNGEVKEYPIHLENIQLFRMHGQRWAIINKQNEVIVMISHGIEEPAEQNGEGSKEYLLYIMNPTIVKDLSF